MQVIGFLSLDDFVQELKAEGLSLVRVQPYLKRETDKDTGLVRLHYFVVAQAVSERGDVLIARFHTGSAWQHEIERAQLREENNETAAQILGRYLAGLGYQVRPGIIAAGAQDSTLASTNLWKFQQGRLVASNQVALASQEPE